VQQAFLLGLDNTTITFDALNVMGEGPFSTEAFARCKREPETFLEESHPGIAKLVNILSANFRELGSMWGFTYWSIEKAKRVLGYRPRNNFPEFFEAFKSDDRSHYPYANLLWWGV